jgi:parvulin-like peptidyl-prolyl isomerase
MPSGDDTAQLVQNDDQLFVIDSIKAVIYGQQRTDIVTLSDELRPSLDGRPQSLDDLVLAKLICQDAARFKMEPDDEVVNKHLKAVQRENNLSLDDLKSIFKQAGYTYEEGRAQFKSITAVGTMIDFRIRSRLVVPEREIQAYYLEHPEIEEASYQIQIAQVRQPEGMDHDVFMAKIRELVDTGSGSIDVSWTEPFWIKKSDIAQDKTFLMSMEVGTIALGKQSAAGIEVFKLKNKKEEHVRTLEERYNEIAEILKRPKYNELFEAYKKELFINAAIVYFQ